MSGKYKEWKRLLFWNGLWLIVLLIIGINWGIGMAFDHVDKDVSAVRTSWNADTLCFSSIRGYVVITHLAGYSQDTPVAAQLPKPAFLLDSEGARVERNTWDKLEWRDEVGNIRPPPSIGSRIVGLYHRLQPTEWQDSKSE